MVYFKQDFQISLLYDLFIVRNPVLKSYAVYIKYTNFGVFAIVDLHCRFCSKSNILRLFFKHLFLLLSLEMAKKLDFHIFTYHKYVVNVENLPLQNTHIGRF